MRRRGRGGVRRCKVRGKVEHCRGDAKDERSDEESITGATKHQRDDERVVLERRRRVFLLLERDATPRAAFVAFRGAGVSSARDRAGFDRGGRRLRRRRERVRRPRRRRVRAGAGSVAAGAGRRPPRRTRSRSRARSRPRRGPVARGRVFAADLVWTDEEEGGGGGGAGRGTRAAAAAAEGPSRGAGDLRGGPRAPNEGEGGGGEAGEAGGGARRDGEVNERST